MESIFLNAGLAAGVGLACLPVILHLFMRPTPKRIIFPALQLIRERQKRAKRTLKVKNWLLLLARMALVALMALALARPRLYSKTPLGDQSVPTALALVVDTSLSMQFTEKGKNRLEEAKERGLEILKKLPETSQVFVIDTAEAGVPVALSPATARKQLQALTFRAANRHLNASMGQAYTAVVGSERPRREVYVLTDLAASAWNLSQPAEGLEKLKGLKVQVSTYVIRLTPKEIKDVAIAVAEPGASAGAGDASEVRTVIRSVGPATSRVVEFKVDGQVRDKKTVEIPADGEIELRFNTPKLEPKLHRGEIILTGGKDAMEFDDKRFLTFKV